MAIYVQYTNAINLKSLLYGGTKSKINGLPYPGLLKYLTINELDFLTGYFSLSNTTTTQGLNNWGRILQISRTIRVPNIIDNSILGFDTGTPPDPIDTGYPQNFNNGNFYGGETTLYRLNDPQFLFLLQMRYATLNTNSSLASANLILNTYFKALDPAQEVTVTDDGPMNMLISLLLPAPAYQVYILNYRSDVLPIPAGVKYSVNATYA